MGVTMSSGTTRRRYSVVMYYTTQSGEARMFVVREFDAARLADDFLMQLRDASIKAPVKIAGAKCSFAFTCIVGVNTVKKNGWTIVDREWR